MLRKIALTLVAAVALGTWSAPANSTAGPSTRLAPWQSRNAAASSRAGVNKDIRKTAPAPPRCDPGRTCPIPVPYPNLSTYDPPPASKSLGRT
jgi:hypothetical protein